MIKDVLLGLGIPMALGFGPFVVVKIITLIKTKYDKK